MANPFSGLENIGQSYLAGVQLAQQRQLRQDALAQRQEEARIRERYYQDLIDQRREAATLNAKIREENLAAKFGRFLKRTPEGDIDIVGSATAQEEAGNRNQFLETVGFAESQGVPIPGVQLTPEERKSEFFNKGRAQGIIQKTKDQMQFDRILASQGVFPMGSQTQIPADLEPFITGQAPATVFDILSGTAPTAPAPRVEVPEGMITGRVAGRDVLMRKPKVQVVKADRPNTVNILDEFGKVVATRKLTDEAYAAWEATQPPGGAPAGSGTTNVVPVGRITFDPNAPLGATFTPLK